VGTGPVGVATPPCASWGGTCVLAAEHAIVSSKWGPLITAQPLPTRRFIRAWLFESRAGTSVGWYQQAWAVTPQLAKALQPARGTTSVAISIFSKYHNSRIKCFGKSLRWSVSRYLVVQVAAWLWSSVTVHRPAGRRPVGWPPSQAGLALQPPDWSAACSFAHTNPRGIMTQMTAGRQYGELMQGVRARAA
jgi:hypothetical protein